MKWQYEYAEKLKGLEFEESEKEDGIAILKKFTEYNMEGYHIDEILSMLLAEFGRENKALEKFGEQFSGYYTEKRVYKKPRI